MVVILFDLEGTLIKSIDIKDEQAILEFRVETKKKLLELGIPSNLLKNVKKSTLMRNIAIDYVKKNYDEKKANLFNLEMDRFLKRYEMSWAKQSEIFPETLPVLNKLKKLGYRLGIVTNTSLEAANYMLSLHGIRDFFEAIISRESVKKLKPDPEGILLALKKLNEKKFFFIGDLVHDSKAAKKADGECMIVNRNSNRRIDFQTDYIIKSLEEIPRIIQSRYSK